MTESEWLACDDPTRMLRCLGIDGGPRPHGPDAGPVGRISDRKLRLFACACCRQVWDRLTDERSRRAVEVAERYADGLASEEELIAHELMASNVDNYAIDQTPAEFGWNTARLSAKLLARNTTYFRLVSPAIQAALLRDIVGNPFRSFFRWDEAVLWSKDEYAPAPVRLPWSVPKWRDGLILSMARVIYDERRFEDMPILADALEDAGCDNESILRHCRGQQLCPKCLGSGKDHATSGGYEAECPCAWKSNPERVAPGWVPAGQHCRGCWVIDLILGKE